MKHIPPGIIKGIESYIVGGGYQDQLAKAWGWVFNYIVKHSTIPEKLLKKRWNIIRNDIIDSICYYDYDEDRHYTGTGTAIPEFHEIYDNGNFNLDYDNLKFEEKDTIMYRMVSTFIKYLDDTHEGSIVSIFFAYLNS